MGKGSKGGRGAREGRKLQRRYPEEGTCQCTVYSQTIPQAALGLEILVLHMKNSEQVYIINSALRCVIMYCLTGG